MSSTIHAHRTNTRSSCTSCGIITDLPDERLLVLRERSQLQWTGNARIAASAELFEGDDPILSPGEVLLLDALDSKLERGDGDSVWGTD